MLSDLLLEFLSLEKAYFIIEPMERTETIAKRFDSQVNIERVCRNLFAEITDNLKDACGNIIIEATIIKTAIRIIP